MKLEDLFVSYKQVSPPIIKKPVIEEPTNKFQNLLDYLNIRETKQETQQQLEEDPLIYFEGWNIPTPTVTGSTFNWQQRFNKGKDDWVKMMEEAYRKAGITNENAIKNLIAKNALESGWGRSASGDYNFGNITTGNSWTGSTYTGKDHDANGNPTTHTFRSYSSVDDFVKDELALLRRRYDFNEDDDINAFLNKLQGNNKSKWSYAEDKDYINKVKGVYNSLG